MSESYHVRMEAEILLIRCRLEGMIAENQKCIIEKQVPTYSQESFDDLTPTLNYIIGDIRRYD